MDRRSKAELFEEIRRGLRVRVGSVAGWSRLIAAVGEALRLGATDAAAVLHIFYTPDPEQRGQYALDLAEELAQFERPMMDDCDLLLTGTPGGLQMKSQTESLEHAACGNTTKPFVRPPSERTLFRWPCKP